METSRRQEEPSRGLPSAVPLTASNNLAPEQHLAIALHSLTRQLGRRPEVNDYRELCERDPSLPSFSEIHAAYGSWSVTLEEAGLTADDDQSPVWRDVCLEAQVLTVDVSPHRIFGLAEEIHFLKLVAAEQGIDLGDVGAVWDPEWRPEPAEPIWADQALARDPEARD